MTAPASIPAAARAAIEASRAKILASLRDARDVTFVRHSGNIGDDLIYAGARRLLADVDYAEISIFDLGDVGGDVGVLSGGGGWCEAFSHMPEYLPLMEQRFERVIVLPTSFDVRLERVRETLERTRALVFAREAVSYESIAPLCRSELAHDCAFFFDFEGFRRPGRGALNAFRGDPEAAGGPIPDGNEDISATCDSLDEFLWKISRRERIRTDRAHVMIAAAMMGKIVEFRSSNYHKLPAIADFALQGFPATQHPADWAPEGRPRRTAPRSRPWRAALRGLTAEILRRASRGSELILLGSHEMGDLPLWERRVRPFLESDGVYAGPPPDDETAIAELERMRKSGATLFVAPSWQFWWFKSYPRFAAHLKSRYRRLEQSETVEIYALDQPAAVDRR